MLKTSTTIAACLGTLLALQAPGAIVTLPNGDRISGTVVDRADGKIMLLTQSLGTLAIPEEGASVKLTPEEQAALDAAAAGTEPAETPKKQQAAQSQETKDAFYNYVYKAKNWVDGLVPPGWGGLFSVGANFTETNSKTTGLALGFNATKDSGDNHYTIFAFYDYKNTVNQDGVQDKQLDKWGGGFKYRRDLDEHFFLLSNTVYQRDQVKDIRHEVTQDLGIGYYFYNTPDIVLYIAPAFTPQYKDAERVGKKWYYMATLLQEFKYKLNHSVRIEQSLQGSIEPGDDNNYSYKARIAAITKLTDWIDLIVAYNYNWDNTVGEGGSKKEQIATVSLGIPF